jgi:membrane protein involved in colicin uptake
MRRRADVARLFDEAAVEGPEEQEEAAAAAPTAHAEDIEQLLGGGEGADAPSQSVGSGSSDEPAGDEGESAGESEGEGETEGSGGEDDFLKDESRWGRLCGCA